MQKHRVTVFGQAPLLRGTYHGTHISRGHSECDNAVGFGTFRGFSELLVQCAKISLSLWGGVCVYFLKSVRKGRFRNVWVGGGGSETIFLHNRGPKLDVARIFSNLPAQLAEVCNPGFPVPGDAPTYRYLTTQSNRLY